MTDDVVQKIHALSCFHDPQDIKPLGGGLTNVNVLVRDGGQKYVVRLGADIPEHGVMRWNELALSRAASAAGFSPQVVHAEPSVLVLDYIDAKTFDESDVRDPANLPRIIEMMKAMHRQLGPHLTQPVLAFWPAQVNQTYIARLIADGSSHKAALPQMLAQNADLETATGAVNLVIGHNDLLAANILDDGQKLWLIDWEYGGYNTPFFDLAGLASNNSFSEQQEGAVLEQYFEVAADQHWRAFTAMKCASLMRETLWSMTSEIHSDLDVNYAAYTHENMEKLTAALADFSQT